MSSAVNEVVGVTWDGPVAVVTLNRPEALNAASADLHHAITHVWAGLAADSRLRSAVLTGAGKAFSAGGDLDLLQDMADDRKLRADVLAEAGELVQAVASFPVPIVAAVNGPAVGLGCSLASLCDLVVMEEQAFFADPHVSLGLAAADGAVFTWPAQMPLPKVKEFVYLGRRITSAEALALGLVNEVVATGQSVEKALVLAHKLAKLPPQALRETKAILNAPLRDRLRAEAGEAFISEAESFDAPEFQANLAAMRAK
ncbi:MAG TPA: enoyl-CoA hydratase/isomerase family protein [Frankiaceae bacterium]|jgi:enoyl-CoA hydratase|nr:enoyl-CoA hydratase/isomerase family protein [Frankiaceae bacterium]